MLKTSGSNFLGQLIVLPLSILRTDIFVALSETESLMLMRQAKIVSKDSPISRETRRARGPELVMYWHFINFIN